MSREILLLVDALAREKNVPREIVFGALESALAAATKRLFDEEDVDIRVAVDRDPKYSAAWKALGKALAASGDHPAAIAAYEAGIAVANQRGDIQAAKEMGVFLKRLQKAAGGS